MRNEKYIAPSLLSADFVHLNKEIEMINQSKADWVHIDVMDGIFVPNISFGQPVIKCIKNHTTKPLDVHLMINQPERYIESFKKVGADILTIHYEASIHTNRIIHAIKDLNMLAGIAINPSTPIAFLEDIINEVDLVLLMSVNPGFGGQKFIDNTYKKIEQLNLMLNKSNNNHCLIEVDGGINITHSSKLFQYGVNILVAGSSIFNSSCPIETIAKLKES